MHFIWPLILLFYTPTTVVIPVVFIFREIIQSIMADEGMSTPFYSAEQTGANSDLHTTFTDIFKNDPSQTSSTTPLHSPSQTRYVPTADTRWVHY